MGDREYLLTYGNVGDFGRFRLAEPLTCRRGDPVVVRSPRGQELGVIMRPATPGIGRLLADQFVGQIVRLATEGDLQLAQRMQQRSQRLFEDGCRLVRELDLPMQLLDAEILLDGRQAVLHYLRWTDCDPRPLMDPLAQRYHVLVTLHDLALPSTEDDHEHAEHAGCGTNGCGGGGCGSCSTGNCASCVHHASEPDAPARDVLAGASGPEARPVLAGVPAAVLDAPPRVPLL